MKDGEELVEEPFQRLIRGGKLIAYPYDGFWACMDTFKDKQLLEDLTRGASAVGGLEGEGKSCSRGHT